MKRAGRSAVFTVAAAFALTVPASSLATTTAGSGDLTAPRTKLTYPVHQDFLAKKRVLIRLRSNEAATAVASGQLEYPSGDSKRGRTVYGLRGVERQVAAGSKTTLRLGLPAMTREAGELALSHGKKVVVKVTVTATDAAGNRSGATVAVIHPPGR